MTPYTEDFETFWVKYPSRWNKDLGIAVKRKKRPAFEKWLKLTDHIRAEILSKIHLIKHSEGGSVRDAVTWLNQYGWEDIDLPVKYVPALPKELTKGALKQVESTKVNVSNKRNRQKDKMGV